MRNCYPCLLLVIIWTYPLAGEPPQFNDALPVGAIARLGSRNGKYFEPRAHEFVNGGRVLMMIYDGPEVARLDVQTGRLLQVWRLGTDSLESVRISSDGRLIAAQLEPSIVVWDLDSGQRMRELRLEDRSFELIELSPNGSTVYARSQDDLITFDVKTGRIRQLARVSAADNSPRFLFTGKRLLINAKPTLRCLDLETGNVLWVIPWIERFEQVRILHDKQFWFPGTDPNLNGSAVYDLESGKPSYNGKNANPSELSCISHNGRINLDAEKGFRDLATGTILSKPLNFAQALDYTPDDQSLLGVDLAGYLQRWDVATGQPHYPHPTIAAHSGAVTWLSYFPDGRSIISRDDHESQVRIWNLGTRQFRSVLDLPGDSNFDSVLLPDGHRLLSLPYESPPTIFNLETGKAVQPFEMPAWTKGHTFVPWASPLGKSVHVMINPNENETEKWDRWLMTWDTATGKLLGQRAEKDWVGPLVFSPDGSLIATRTHGVRQTISGRSRLPVSFEDHVWQFAFSPDQTRLAASMVPPEEPLNPEFRDRLGVAIFELATGKRIALLPATMARGLWFTNDGRRLMTAAGLQKTIQVWDLGANRELQRWSMPDNWGFFENFFDSRVLAIHPDGKQFATGHDDGTILLWTLPPTVSRKVVTRQDHDRLWADLAAEDATTAWAAIDRLSDSPDQALALLHERLRPIPPLDAKRVEALIEDLAADSYRTRDAARMALESMSDRVEPLLQDALGKSKSAEQQSSLKRLLYHIKVDQNPDHIRRWRAVVVLERFGTREAKTILEQMARNPASRIEGESAAAALSRLAK